jgi:hypothetical protein
VFLEAMGEDIAILVVVVGDWGMSGLGELRGLFIPLVVQLEWKLP